MKKTIEKLVDLEYNELVTLGLIEQNEDLNSIFTSEINLPFTTLYQLQVNGKLSEPTKELLVNLFEKVILTRTEFIDKYKRMLTSPPVVKQTVTDVSGVGQFQKKIKKESVVPRRYGKEKIMQDIGTEKASSIQRAMLASNDLKNMYVNVNNRLIKDYFTKENTLSDVQYREIASAITTLQRLIKPIIKKV
jgi:hypothetical protein